MFLIELLLLLGFPLFIALGAGWLCWGALSRPVVFMVVASAVLYATYIGAFYFLAPQSVGYAISAWHPGDPPPSNPTFMLLEPYKLPLAIFAVVAFPVVVGLLRLFKKDPEVASEV